MRKKNKRTDTEIFRELEVKAARVHSGAPQHRERHLVFWFKGVVWSIIISESCQCGFFDSLHAPPGVPSPESGYCLSACLASVQALPLVIPHGDTQGGAPKGVGDNILFLFSHVLQN